MFQQFELFHSQPCQKQVENNRLPPGLFFFFFFGKGDGVEVLQGEKHSRVLGEGGQAAALLAQICCSEEVGGGGATPLNFHKGKHTLFFSLCV